MVQEGLDSTLYRQDKHVPQVRYGGGSKALRRDIELAKDPECGTFGARSENRSAVNPWQTGKERFSNSAASGMHLKSPQVRTLPAVDNSWPPILTRHEHHCMHSQLT